MPPATKRPWAPPMLTRFEACSKPCTIVEHPLPHRELANFLHVIEISLKPADRASVTPNMSFNRTHYGRAGLAATGHAWLLSFRGQAYPASARRLTLR
jgi:hypothetical protein